MATKNDRQASSAEYLNEISRLRIKIEEMERGIHVGTHPDSKGSQSTLLVSREDVFLAICCDFYWDLFPDKMLIAFSAGYIGITGYDKVVYDDFSELQARVHPEDVPRYNKNLFEAVEGRKDSFNYEFRYLRADGTYIWLNNRCHTLKNNEGRVVAIIGLSNDISEIRRREEMLKEEKLKNSLLIRTATDFIWEYDVFKKRFKFNSKHEDYLGAKIASSLKKEILDFLKKFGREIECDKKIVGQLSVANQMGTGVSWYEVSCFVLLNSKKERYKIIGAMRNIDDRIKLEKAAYRDDVTGVFNRRAAVEALIKAFKDYQDNRRNYVVLFLDIDDFKRINDTYGHAGGDTVLHQFSQLLKDMVEPLHGHIYRWGGEELVILAPFKSEVSALRRAEMLRKSVEELNIPWNGGQISVTVSVGISTFHSGDENYSNAVSRADQGVYKVKANGKNGIIFIKEY